VCPASRSRKQRGCAGQHDLAVALSGAAGSPRAPRGVPAPRPPRTKGDHAERTRERAAVLDLHEGPRPLEARVERAADRATSPAITSGAPRSALTTDTFGPIARVLRRGSPHPGRVSARASAPLARRPGGTSTRPRSSQRVYDGDLDARLCLSWPSASRRSRTACASAYDTLQPRNWTEKVVAEEQAVRSLERVCRPAVEPSRSIVVQPGAQARRRRGSRR
jgi:hypothetical protein